MRCCTKGGTDEASKLDKKITKDLRQEVRDKSKSKPVKILLLGAGDSGKSTLAKQMKILFLNGYTEEEKKGIIPAVHANVLSNIKDILKGVQKYKLSLPPEIQEIATSVATMQSFEPWTVQLVEKFKILLMNAEVQKVLKKSAELQLYEHMDYMLSRLDEFVSPSYIPSEDDILRVKVRTTGIMEISYHLDGYNFTVVDMGGQRSERRKWIFFFENVTAVIFVLALNEYDLKLREDPNMNRMQESLDLFKKVINNEFLKDTAIILFLNKIDLFRDKIQRSDLRGCFPNYTGGPNYDSAIKYIGEQFKSFDMSAKRNIFTHPTCATDTDNIRTVLNDVRLTLIQKVLQEIGILM